MTHQYYARWFYDEDTIEYVMSQNGVIETGSDSGMDNMSHQVFISYSRHDSEILSQIRSILDTNGISYWIDTDGMHSRGSFKSVLVDAIRTSDAIIFLSSKNSNASEFVAKEISLAVSYKKMIIPLMLDNTPVTKSIEFDLKDIDQLDFHGEFEKKLLDNLFFAIGRKQRKDSNNYYDEYMNISDSIQFMMLIASTAAIIVSAWMSKKTIKASMIMVREQNQIQMFAEYTKRYQEIIMNMPKRVYDGRDILDDDVLRYMKLYFNLCSEEYDLKNKDAINTDVWERWLSGIICTMHHPVYQKAWEMEKNNYAADPAFIDFLDSCVKE